VAVIKRLEGASPCIACATAKRVAELTAFGVIRVAACQTN